MSTPDSREKRRRAAAFPARPGPTPDIAPLHVRWANAFDRSCFLVATPALPSRHRAAYEHLMHELTVETGCNEAEVLAHGRKVRRRLEAARQELRQAGAFAGLATGQTYLFFLPAVRPAF